MKFTDPNVVDMSDPNSARSFGSLSRAMPRSAQKKPTDDEDEEAAKLVASRRQIKLPPRNS